MHVRTGTNCTKERIKDRTVSIDALQVGTGEFFLGQGFQIVFLHEVLVHIDEIWSRFVPLLRYRPFYKRPFVISKKTIRQGFSAIVTTTTTTNDTSKWQRVHTQT